ncbi:MAG: DUF4345 domain-containing protein [Acidimicrobiia bacterium]|nr:DUF4345 domain-containing protein [Acidimicrobiia bacterium]
MAFPRIVLALSAFIYAAFGAAFLVAPVPMAATVGIQLPEPSAVIDFRATYGGFELGLAAFLAWCLAAPDPSTRLGAGPSTRLGAGPSTRLGAGPSTRLGAGRVRAGLLVSFLTVAGFGLTRLAGVVLDGPVRQSIYIALALEMSGVVLTGLALWQLASKEELT